MQCELAWCAIMRGPFLLSSSPSFFSTVSIIEKLSSPSVNLHLVMRESLCDGWTACVFASVIAFHRRPQAVSPLSEAHLVPMVIIKSVNQ